MERPEESHLFMCCTKLREQAFTPIPPGYHLRYCRPEELSLWKDFPFDTQEQAKEYRPFMDTYFCQTYGKQQEEFYHSCLFLCDQEDRPLCTGFLWKHYGRYTTLHWLKTKKEAEGRGLGRAILSEIFGKIKKEDYPIYLHTHAGCERAVHLYTEFGFRILTRPQEIDGKPNQWKQVLDYLQGKMPPAYFSALSFTEPDENTQLCNSGNFCFK